MLNTDKDVASLGREAPEQIGNFSVGENKSPISFRGLIGVAVWSELGRDSRPWQLLFSIAPRMSLVGKSSAGLNFPASQLHRFSIFQPARARTNRGVARDVPKYSWLNDVGRKACESPPAWAGLIQVIFPEACSFLPFIRLPRRKYSDCAPRRDYDPTNYIQYCPL